MRGKDPLLIPMLELGVVSPAYAGKGPPDACRQPYAWDHPRVCGEKVLFGYCAFYGVGSPPRMRGKAARNSAAGYADRITPAYAGKRVKRNEQHNP